MNRKNIQYRNDIKKIFDVTTFKCNNEDLNKVPVRYDNEGYFTIYCTKDGIPIQDRFNTLKEAIHHAKWVVFSTGKKVTITCMTQVTFMQDVKTLFPLEQEPADRQECSEAKRACNEIAHQCKNFANANGEAMPIGKSQEFQIPEIPF